MSVKLKQVIQRVKGAKKYPCLEIFDRKSQADRSRFKRFFFLGLLFTTLFLLIYLSQAVIAQLAQTTFPTNPDVLFQTSGPGRLPGVGDWYTTNNQAIVPPPGGQSSGSTDRLHRFFINVTQQDLNAAVRDGVPIVIGVIGGQSNGGSDEINDRSLNDFPNEIDRSCPPQPDCDPTRFTVRDANNSILATQVFPSGTPPSANFVPLLTVTAPGVYQVTSETGALPIFGDPTLALNNDDNSFQVVLQGSAQSVPLIGQTQGTFQRNTTNINAPPLTVPFYFLVGPDVNTLLLRNFDLDVPNFTAIADVEYFSPTGGSAPIPGTPSGDAVWNNNGTLNAGADTLPITPIADAGIWEADFTNYNASNQTLFEANTGDNQRLVVFDATPTRAGNFTVSQPRPPVQVQEAFCYDYAIANLFFTTDIINLRVLDLPQGFTVQYFFGDRTTPLPDTDQDGNPDTGTPLAAFTGSRTVSVCITPSPDAPQQTNLQVAFTSFMDGRVREQIAPFTGIDPAPIPVILPLQIDRDAPPQPETPTTPNLRLVKRIIDVIRNGNSLPGVNFAEVLDDPTTTNDNSPGWSQIPLIGIINLPITNPAQSGDIVTYRVYFLSDGIAPVFTVSVCDLIPGGTTYVPNTTQLQVANGAIAPGGQFFSPLEPLPLENACPVQENPNGTVIVNLGNVSNVAGNNFGFIQFQVRIN